MSAGPVRRSGAVRARTAVGVTAGAMGLMAGTPAGAVDLDWSETAGLLTYNTPDHWTPNSAVGGPTDADNVTFSILIAPEPFIILGATNDANDVNVLDNVWTFTSAGGSTFDTEGAVTVDDTSAGSLLDGADLTVDAAVDWDNAGDLFVGDTGYGTLTLEANTDFRGASVYVGDDLGAVGLLNVDGSGTTLTADAVGSTLGIFVGNAGTGTLNVTNQGYVTTTDTTGAADIELGTAATGNGTLNIDGAGSLVNAEDTIIGVEGAGTLNITNGGVFDQNLNNSADGLIGFSGGTGDAIVNGAGSQWLMRRLDVGRSGVGTLSVEAGALVRANEASNGSNGDVIIGTRAAGADPIADPLGDGTVAVFGVGSTLDVDDNLIVGDAGKGTLRIGQNLTGAADGNGTLLVDVNLIVGDDAGNTNANLVVVDGANATAEVGNRTVVGDTGTGTLHVTGGAQFDTEFLRVAEVVGGDGTLLVSGLNTELDVTTTAIADTVIGTADGATATVSDLAIMRNNQLWVGFLGTGDGMLTVDNADVIAGQDNTGDLIVGGDLAQAGGAGTVTIQNGGRVVAADEVYLGGNATGDGTLIVTGAGSLLDNDDNAAGVSPNDILRIGHAGRGVAEVRDGGRIEAEGLLIGNTAGSAEASLLVTGAGSTVESSGYLFVGNGRTGTMTVEQGAQVEISTNTTSAAADRRIFIGDDNAADGSKLTITDPGSRLDYFGTGDVSVGNAGGSTTNRATVEVLNGGVFSAVQRDPNDSNVILSDARIIIGDVDNGNGLVTVDGTGSLVEARVIYVGDGTNNSSGILDIKNGGVATTVNEVEAGSNGNATGNVFVTGPDSRLEVGGFLSLGDDLPTNGTATGTLFVSEGGAVTTAGQAYIGRRSGSTGNATVSSTTNDTSTWTVDGDLILAGTETSSQSTGSGNLGVLTGGRVTVNQALRIRNLGSVSLSGGEIQTTSLEFVDAGSNFTWGSGTLRFITTPTVDLTTTLLERTLDSTNPTLATGQHLAVDNTAVLSSPLRLNGGELSIGTVFNGDLSNLDFDAGTFNLTQNNLTVGSNGIFGDTLTVTENQTVNVTNDAVIEGSRTLTVVGEFTANQLTNNGDLVLVDPTGLGKTFTPTVITPAGSTVTLVGDATFTGNVSGAGNFFGPGDATFAGGYDPGDSPATVTFESGFHLTDGQTLALELAGTAPGQFDRLEATGTVTLDGLLDVSLLGGFAPALGNTFEVISALGGLGGAFDATVLPALTAGLAWDVLTDANSLTLAVVAAAGINGDYNDNGLVEQGDLNQVLNNWGQPFDQVSASWINQRPTEGIVDQAELNVVLNRWGSDSAPDFSGNAVPEPAALALLTLSLGLGRGRRRVR